jgi:acyl-CoA synthetase (NDP forming)
MAMAKDVTFPPFVEEARPKIAATLNEYVAIDNPLDYHTFIWNQEDKLTATFSSVLQSGFDAAMLILDIPTNPKMRPDTWLVTAKALINAADRTKARAAMVASLPECMPLDLAAELSVHNVAPLMGLDDALSAFEAAAVIGRNWARPEKLPELAEKSSNNAELRTLSEREAKLLLAKHGLAIPQGLVCKASEAVNAARGIGYPVTLKVSSPDIAHKTEAGGVALNLKTDDEVKAAATRLAKLAPDVLIEEMVTGAVAELIIGLKSDPQFGLALVVGAGGILTELLKDSATLLLPATRAEIERALEKLRVWKLIQGFRGQSGDAGAVIAAIEGIAAFAAAYPGEIEELDVNPLLVLKDGAIAVDALIRMRNS